MRWIDTHAHLQDKSFAGDWQDVLARAEAAGVQAVILAGSNLEDARRACQMALEDRRLYVAVGVHPHDAKSITPDTLPALRQLVEETNAAAAAAQRAPVVVAVGEIGLDYHYDHSPRPVQQQAFRDQIRLAGELRLPLVIHDREAYADTLEILQQAAVDGLLLPEHPGVMHCFSGNTESMKPLLKLGFYLGFDGPITFKNARKALEVIAEAPHDRLLLETDCPYLAPVPHRGKRNEPAYLPLIGARMAEVLQRTTADVAQLTTANACRLFNLTLP